MTPSGELAGIWQQTPDALTLIHALGDDLQALLIGVKALAWCLGIWVTLMAILRLVRKGNEGGGGNNDEIGYGSIIIMFASGVFLFHLPDTINSLSYTAFEHEGNALAYTQTPQLSQKFNNALQAVFLFIGLAGYVSVVVGLMDWKHVAEGLRRGTYAKGWWHLIGGWAAIHLDDVMNVFKASIT